MTEAQEKFLSTVQRYEAAKEELKLIKEGLELSMQELGVGNHFQDPADGTVYLIVKPAGTFISYSDFAYERTKKPGEAKGSLSMKRADELGYHIK